MELIDYCQNCINAINSAESGKHILLYSTCFDISSVLKGIHRQGKIGYVIDSNNKSLSYLETLREICKQNKIVLISISDINEKFLFENSVETLILESAYLILRDKVRHMIYIWNPECLIGITDSELLDRKKIIYDYYSDIILHQDTFWAIANNIISFDASARITEYASKDDIDIDAIYQKYQECGGHMICMCPDGRADISTRIKQHYQNDSIFIVDNRTTPEEYEQILTSYHSCTDAVLFAFSSLKKDYRLNITNSFVNLSNFTSYDDYANAVQPCLAFLNNKNSFFVWDFVPENDEYKITILSLLREQYLYLARFQKEFLSSEHLLTDILHILHKNILPYAPGRKVMDVIRKGYFDTIIEQAENVLVDKEMFISLDGLRTSISPYIMERYNIHFNKKSIFISEPNLLNRCLITIRDGQIFAKETTFDNAVEIAKKVCEVYPEYYHIWDMHQFKKWENDSVTEQQSVRLMRVNIIDDIPDVLTKAQAHILITLDTSFKVLKKVFLKEGILFRNVKKKKTFDEKEKRALEVYKNKINQEEKAIQDGLELFDNYYQRILERYEYIMNTNFLYRKEDTEFWALENPIIFTKKINTNLTFLCTLHPSEKQMDLIDDIIHQLEEEYIYFDDMIMICRNELQAGIAIKILLELKKIFPSLETRQECGYQNILIDTDSFNKSVTNSTAREIDIKISIYRQKEG